MTYSLETIGSGDMLWALFNAIASLLRPEGGSLLTSFMTLGTAIGAVSALGYTVFRNELKPFLSWFVTTQVIMVGLLSPVSTLVIKDVLTGHVRSVDNVPFALAFTASTFSNIGTGITKAIEAVFQPAPSYAGGSGFQPQTSDQLAYSQTGFMFAAHLMTQMKGVQLANDDMMDNMKEFVNQCVVYDALIGTKYTLHDLKRSDNLWHLVSTGASQLRGFAWREVTRDARGGHIGSQPTTIVTCKAGVEKFNHMWREATTSLMTGFQDKLREQCGLPANAGTQTLSNGVLMKVPGALNKLTHSAKQASEHLQQQVMISSILMANERKSMELGGSPNFDVRRAYLQQRNTYQTIGQTMAQTLPSLKNVFEALVYALFIFVVMVAMLPSGGKMFLFYMKVMLWLQLWPPLFSILNFIMTESLYASTAGAMKTASGITIANMVGLTNIANDMAATAGYLTASVPVLSWALIDRGGYAFVSMASGILGVSQSAASNAALEKTTGNYSFGNVGIQGTQAYNTSMLKQDSAASYTGGYFATNEGMTSKTVMSDGEVVVNRAESHLPVTPSIQEGREEVLRAAQSQADSLQHSYSESASESKRSAASNFIEFGKHASSARASGVTYGNDETTHVTNEAANNYEKLKHISDKYGISQDLLNQHAATIHGGASTPSILPVHLGAQYQNTENASAAAQHATDELHQLAKSDSFRESMSHMHQASVNKNFNTNDQQLNQLAENVSGSFEKSMQYEQQSHKARDVSQSIQEERAQNQTFGARIDANLTQEFVNHLGADKVQKMSARELFQASKPFVERETHAYRQSVLQKFDVAGLRQDLDTQYQNKQLGHGAQDVQQNFKGQNAFVRSEASQSGPVGKVDETPRLESQQMMAYNTSAVMNRGAANKAKVLNGEEAFAKEMKEDTQKGLSNVQSVAATNTYQKFNIRNEKD